MQKVKVGNIIALKDKQTIQDLLEKGSKDGVLNVTVDRVDSYKFNTITWTVIRFKDSELVLVEKIIDNNPQYFLYFTPNGLTGGTREDIIKRGDEWLFNPPKNENKYNVNDLTYADKIYQDNLEFKVVTTFISQSKPLWLLTEWVTTEKTDNDRLIALEVGDYINFWQGCEITAGELEVYE